jgi:hypothetical protein
MSCRRGQWGLVFGVLGFLVVGFLAAGSASATVYSDPTGDEFSNNAHLDISSVEVTNDATNLRFTISLAGSPITTDWGKYMIGIDSVAGGDTRVNGNAWGRPIQMSSGMDYWVGSWVNDNGGGAEVYHFSDTDWVRDRASYDNNLAKPTITATSATLTVPLAVLGLEDGESFNFDVYSAGGGGTDSANDASSNPNRSTTDWPGPYDSGANVSTYTVVVPEPVALGALALGMIGLLGRRRR